MPTIAIPIDKATEHKLIARAKREGRTIEDIIESAIEELLARAPQSR